MTRAAELRRIRRAIARLPPQQREVFDAARYDDLNNQEIAARMGLSVAEVENLLAKAVHAITWGPDPRPRRWWRR